MFKKFFSKLKARKLVFATLLTSGFTASAKVLAAVKEIYVAYLFGVGDLLDAYLIALVMVVFLTSTLGGAMRLSFVPQFIKLIDAGNLASAQKLFRSILFVFWIGVLLLSFLLIGFRGPILQLLASGFSPEKQALAQTLVLFLMPILFLSCNSMFMTAVLNARDRYVFSGLAATANSFGIMLSLFFLGTQWGIYGLALSSLIGFLLEYIILFVELCKIKIIPLPRWFGKDRKIREVFEQYFPAAAGCFIMTQSPLIDQAMAAMLGSGNVSALNFGQKLPSLVLTITSMGLAASLLPHFSKIASQKGHAAVMQNFYTISKKLFLLSLPIMFVLIFGASFFIKILFQRGQFTSEDTQLVARITACLSLQIPFYLFVNTALRALGALNMNRWLLYLGILNFIINIAGNYILMQFWGIAGIALSTSLVYFIASWFILVVFSRKRKSYACASS